MSAIAVASAEDDRASVKMLVRQYQNFTVATITTSTKTISQQENGDPSLWIESYC
jgi:hypothetical protein